MSRHRNVRSLDVHEEYDGYDEVYGHSVEDDYCVSPSTAAQFMYDRSQQHVLSTFMSREPQIPEEEEGENESDEDSMNDSSSFSKPHLTDMQQAKLFSCLEQLRSVLGDSTPDHVLTNAVIKADFSYEKALSEILDQQDAPKPQREPRNRRQRGSQISHTSVAAAAPTQVVDDKKPQLAPHMIRSMSAPDFTKGVARMTFSTNKQTKTGFEGPSAEASTKDDSAVRASSQEPSSADTVMETPKKNMLNAFNQPSSNSKSASKPREKFDVKKEYENRKAGGKDIVNLVVIGHVDAGKSTLMGHVLYQLGFVNKRVMHKYEQEAKKIGKASFAYAWVLDETEEERSRGVTMDVAQTRFETENKLINLLDAPGHKDFIPNMITGAAQADVAVLVVNATRGEFETGFEMGGQTREHAMLIRSLGVSQLIVAVNKMDTVEWSQARFEEITKKLGVFLKQAGFKEADVIFIPCSGLIGENLTKPSDCAELKAWYTGPYLTEQIDKLRPPERPIDKPLRLCVADIFKGQGAGFSVSGTVQAGFVQAGDRVLVMPQGELATVKGIVIEDLPNLVAFAGDNIVMTLTGIEMNNIGIGSIVCDRAEPITACTRFKARVVIFNIDVPITKGFPVLVHYQSLTEPAVIKRLHSLLHKSTGEVVKSKPRCLVKNNSALVELEVSRPICLELYKNYKDLGRFMLRYSGHTIAAGLVTEIVKK